MLASDDGELADKTIIIPSPKSNKTTISNMKSKDLFELLFFIFLAIFIFLYIEYNPIIQSIKVNMQNIETTLFSFHPDNSK